MQNDIGIKEVIFMIIGGVLTLIIYIFITLIGESWKTVDFWVKIATIVNACAVFGVVLLRFQIKAEHERGRREKAVDLLLAWNNSLKKETSLARKTVESFSFEQCQSLFRQEAFQVNKKQYKSILEIMDYDEGDRKEHKQQKAQEEQRAQPESVEQVNQIEPVKQPDKKKNESNDKEDTELDEGEVSKLRWLVLTYLNELESILVAWQYSVANRKIIEAQFSFLFNDANGCNALSNFRKACGGQSCYPAIESFAAHVQREKENKLINEGNVA